MLLNVLVKLSKFHTIQNKRSTNINMNIFIIGYNKGLGVMVFNATFNNISVILWRLSILYGSRI
jgi:hypothetical protein